MSHLCWTDGDLEMANQKDGFEKELQRQINRETKGMSPSEKEEYIRNMFVKKKTKAAKKMTAAKGGMPKKKKPFVSIAKQKEFNLKLKELEKLGKELGISSPKPKMMRGGVAKKKMRGGGMAKMAQKKMMRGGAVKKKMMRGGAVKKK